MCARDQSILGGAGAGSVSKASVCHEFYPQSCLCALWVPMILLFGTPVAALENVVDGSLQLGLCNSAVAPCPGKCVCEHCSSVPQQVCVSTKAEEF